MLKKWSLSGIMALLVLFAFPLIALAATLVIDGNFDDWAGQPFVEDPAGDGPTPNTDVLKFYWGTNPDDDHIYWMMQREMPQSGNPKAYYFVFVDTNNDGNYGQAEDRVVQVMYDPAKNSSNVVVTVYTGDGGQISQSSGDWGDSMKEGGGRVEWRVSFGDLGIQPGQTISMFAGASQNPNQNKLDRIPDNGDITWSPVPVLGWIGVILVGLGIILIAWYRRGRFIWQPR